MNKTVLIGLFVVIVGLVGVGAYSASSSREKEEAMMQKEGTQADMEKDKAMMASTTGDSMMKKDGDAMKKEEGTMMKGAGTYEAYAPSKLAMASAEHKVVLFFHTSWCPSCRALDADIKAHLSSIPANLTILDVDYDSSTDLKKKYGVTMQHTLVEVDAQGTLIKKWTGSPTLSALTSQVQ